MKKKQAKKVSRVPSKSRAVRRKARDLVKDKKAQTRAIAHVVSGISGNAVPLQPTRLPSKIRVGPRFRQDKGDIAGLTRSIEDRGALLAPIVIDPKGELIDGERRLLAWDKSRFAGQPIPVSVVDIDSILAGEWDANAQRKNFTQSEAVAIKRALEGAARQRQLSGKKGDGKGGRAADLAGSFAGKSGRTLEKAERIVEAAEADPERFGKLKDQMDKTGRVDGPFKRLQNMQRGDELRSEPPPVPMNGPYRTLVIDFPWPADLDGDRDAETRGYYPYRTMTMDAICDYAAREIAPILHAEGAAVWVWITNFHLVNGCHVPVLKALGLTGSTMLTWCKPEIGQGQRMRGATEHAILAVRGDVPALGSDQRTWFEAKGGDAHSAKPREFFEIVEKITPASRYAYLFAPGEVPANWDGHGDRIGKVAAADARAAEAELLDEAKGGKKRRRGKKQPEPAADDAAADVRGPVVQHQEGTPADSAQQDDGFGIPDICRRTAPAAEAAE
jgi:N6-adenosine-specific RNA methylase IME4